MPVDFIAAALLMLGQYRSAGPALVQLPSVALPVFVFVTNPPPSVGCVDRVERLSPLGDVEIRRLCFRVSDLAAQLQRGRR